MVADRSKMRVIRWVTYPCRGSRNIVNGVLDDRNRFRHSGFLAIIVADSFRLAINKDRHVVGRTVCDVGKILFVQIKKIGGQYLVI